MLSVVAKTIQIIIIYNVVFESKLTKFGPIEVLSYAQA